MMDDDIAANDNLLNENAGHVLSSRHSRLLMRRRMTERRINSDKQRKASRAKSSYSTSRHRVDKFHLRTNKYSQNLHGVKRKQQKQKWQCLDCAEQFSNKKVLYDHFNTVHKAGCPPCGRAFSSVQDYRTHIDYDCEFSYECSVCGYRTNWKTTLRKHVINHLPAKHCFACDVCPRKCLTANELQTHMLWHSRRPSVPQRNYDCHMCGEKFPYSSALTQHKMKLHPESFDGETVYRCSCCYMTRSLKSWRKHSALDVCQRCGKVFTCAKHYQSHTLTHDGDGSTHVCPVCGKTFSIRKYLTIHLAVHKKDKVKKEIHCVSCDKVFMAKGAYLQHRMKIHPELFSEKILHCHLCKYVTKYAKTLDRHIAGHSVVKNVCVICNKAFHHHSYLRIHTNIHTGEKPFACPICGKKFSSPKYLHTHGRVHANAMSM